MTWNRLHDIDEDTSLAAVLLAGGIFERVEMRTSLDEVIEHESEQLEAEEVAAVMVPIEDYQELMAAYGKRAGGLDATRHRELRAGLVVMEPSDLEKKIMRAKVNTLMAYNRYVWFDADHLWDAMRNLLAITIRHSPQFLRGMSGAQVARMLGVGKAAFNRHKLRLVEDFLERWGVQPAAGANGKGVEHQQKKSEQMKGRKHRSKDYEPDDRPAEQKLTRRQLDAMHAESERARLAGLAGVDPQDIELAKTFPTKRTDTCRFGTRKAPTEQRKIA